MAITKTPVKGMTKEEWLAERRKSIGGSEIGAIMGLSQYADAYTVWMEKTGRAPAFEGNLATEVGTALESFVADKFAQVSGFKVNRTNFIWRNDAYPVLHASPDRLIIGEKNRPLAGLECKTTSVYNAGKVHDVDFPVCYYGQCVQYMMVTELRTWYLAVLVGNSEYHIYMLTRDNAVQKPDWCEGIVYVPQSDIDGLWSMAQDFWSHMESGEAPIPTGIEADDRIIKKVYADVVPGTKDLMAAQGLLKQYAEAKKAEDAASKETKRLQQLLELQMDGMEYGETIGWKVRWKMQPGKTTFDHKACVAQNPDMAQYLKTGKPFRKFEVKQV